MVRAWFTREVVFPLVVGIRGYPWNRLYREMTALEYRPLAEQRKIQWENFLHLYEFVRAHVPYYERKYHGLPATLESVSDLTTLPILTKRDIEANFPDQITAENSPKDDWEYHATGGTTSRLICITDKTTRHIHMARELWSYDVAGKCYLGRKRLGIPPDICSIACGARKSDRDKVLDRIKAVLKGKDKLYNLMVFLRWSLWPVFHQLTYRHRELPSFGSDGTSLKESDLDFYIHEIGKSRPYVLKALPTYLHVLAHHIKENNLVAPPVAIVKPMGASVSPKVRDFIQQVFACDFFEDYGSHEFSGIAAECDAHDGLHVCMSDFIIEVVRDGRHAEEGELGHILITDLKNTVMPFIRYRIGDVGRFYASKCSCGRESVRISLEGRIEDLIVAPNGRVFTGDFFQDFFFLQPDVRFFQLNQQARNRFELLLVPTNGECDRQRIVTDLQEHLGSVQVDCYQVKSIKPEVSGKFRYVKSTTYEDFT
jgi:phenylacetate-CoA ligase